MTILLMHPTPADGQKVLFDYDETKGRLEGIAWLNGTRTMGYDEKGRIITITTEENKIKSYVNLYL